MYPTPLHYRLIPELVYDVEATILFGTDTFLSGYARVAHPYDFHCVRFIVSGAEALKQRTRQIYAERYGVRILEGYGVTEAAPVLAMNSPLASKPGSVGRLSPLVEHRLERVEGMAEHDGDLTIGRLHVRGPNIMLGYLSADAPGVIETPAAGWHDTGDVVAVDTEGFVSIIGRARRFAKVGGEMVPLAVAERLAADLWPAAISVAVARPDARKGERIVLLTTEPRANRARLIAAARAAGVGELAVPADVSHVERLPLLGSGKPDYPAADRLAEELERRSAGVGTAAAANAAG
jgi:acyl-[acyl-carrier-protein]-phospholipid O-acyltransferase/long-chain-fatty-acid--[acyl-carrier-protein] ligase